MRIEFYNNISQISMSLERYGRFILYLDFMSYVYNNSSSNDEIFLIFVLNKEEELENCSRWIYNNNFNPDNLFLMGYDEYSDINLSNVKTLKHQIINCLSKKSSEFLRSRPFFGETVRLFFKGHGEKSLLKSLTETKYYIINYNDLMKSGDFNNDDLYNCFFLKGVESWENFASRYHKYVPIIYTMGWVSEVSLLDKYIDAFSVDLKRINKTSSPPIINEQSILLLNDILLIIEDLAQKQCIK